jgi:hypothetical protein
MGGPTSRPHHESFRNFQFDGDDQRAFFEAVQDAGLNFDSNKRIPVMAKNPFPRQTQQTPPVIPGQPPRFVPGVTSPLDRVKRETATLVPHQVFEEQRRAQALPGNIRSGACAPSTPSSTPTAHGTGAAKPAPCEAGGSKLVDGESSK